jgi:O-methyltransferase
MWKSVLWKEKFEKIVEMTKNLPDGDLAEVGVYQGGITKYLATTFPDRTVHAYDTFAGLPWDNIGKHKAGDFCCDLETVKAYVDCKNVEYHVGIFPETALDKVYAFAHIDTDDYISTLKGLDFFYKHMTKGAVIIVDDYDWGHCPGVTQACKQFDKSYIIGDHQAIYVI